MSTTSAPTNRRSRKARAALAAAVAVAALAATLGTATAANAAPMKKAVDVAHSVDIARSNVDGAATYWILTKSGAVKAVGATNTTYAKNHGGALSGSAVSIAGTPTGRGYAILSSNGHVYTYGDAVYEGQPAGNRGPTSSDPAVAIAMTSSGQGYWIAWKSGTVSAYGDADGAIDALSGHNTIVDVEADPDTSGFWLLTSTGKVLGEHGASAVGHSSGETAAGLIANPSGAGYWIVERNGHVHAYGGATSFGNVSVSGHHAIDGYPTNDGDGYRILFDNGTVKSR